MENKYTFEEYVWHRGIRLGPELRAWHSARPTATEIFDNEQQELTAAEINDKEVLLGLPLLTSLQPRYVHRETDMADTHHLATVDTSVQQQDAPPQYVLTPGTMQSDMDTAPAPIANIETSDQLQPMATSQHQLPSLTVQAAQAVPGVSALRNRPVNNPIKTHDTRKRDAVNYAEPGEIEMPAPSPKKAKYTPKKASAKPAKKATGKGRQKKRPADAVEEETSADIAHMDEQLEIHEGAVDEQARVEEPIKAVRNTRANAASQADKPTRKIATKTPRSQLVPAENAVKLPPSVLLDPFFESVVNGDELPIHRDQATQAFAERKRRMRADYEARPSFQKEKAEAEKRKPTKRGKKSPAIVPYVADMMPEFFEPSNFTKGNSTRCACGAVDDDDYTGIWVGCETKSCKVWQHSDCMGSAVPENIKSKKAPYYCHNCDPWGHRVLIQQLRKGETLSKKPCTK